MVNYSFIIPHHNSPSLLNRLIRSIPLRDDIEIIVVDDNSDADKKAILTRGDIKIIYIDKEHSKGAGHARNVGLNLASGKWLLFADADDFYCEGFLDVLDRYKDNELLDVLFFDIESVDSLTLQKDEKKRANLVNSLIAGYNGSNRSREELLFFSWGPWNKMVRRQFVASYSIKFEEVIKGNDVFFSLQVACFAKNILVEKTPLYVLTYTQNSLTYKKQDFESKLTTLLNMKKRETFYSSFHHCEWTNKYVINRNKYNYFLYIARVVRMQLFVGVRLFFYYLIHNNKINRISHYYVDVIREKQKEKNDCSFFK